MDAEWRKRFLACEKHHFPGRPGSCPHCHWEEGQADKRTMAEWNSVGRRVSKGAKMAERNSEGIPVFTRHSTYVPSPRRSYRPRDFDRYGEGHMDEYIGIFETQG